VQYKVCITINHNMNIYRSLNLKLLVQVGDLPYTQSRWTWAYYIELICLIYL